MTDPPHKGTPGPTLWRPGIEVSTWPALKLARASTHMAELNSSMNTWVAGRPFGSAKELSDDRLSWMLKLAVKTMPPVDEWSLILGDVLHNLRSALDACVWEFAQIGGVPPQPTAIQFPIVRDEARWNDSRRRNLQTVPEEIAERVRLVQPFNRAAEDIPRDALVLLQELSNLDKHRASIAVRLVPTELNADFSLEFSSPEAADRNVPPDVQYYSPDFQDGALLVEHRTVDPIVQTRGGYGVSLETMVDTSSGRQRLSALLEGLFKYTHDLLAVIYGGAERDEPTESSVG